MLARDFYGALRVEDLWDAHRTAYVRDLYHGSINHGEQFLEPARHMQPTTYYGPPTGVGLALRESARQPSLRVGLIGLGTGTLAAYGRPGDTYRFYEISPLVLRIASTQFSFLKDCQAMVDVVLGDARLSLEREQPQNFDVLAVDAFSGDAIPMHLLTREAFALYFRHLKKNGVLAVHVTNAYVNLSPMVRLEAEAFGRTARFFSNDDDDLKHIFSSAWVLVADSPEFFQSPLIAPAAALIRPKKNLRIWTDDYSNLFRVLGNSFQN